MSHGANLLIFTAGGPLRGAAPIVNTGETAPTGAMADPVPQALVLTAIVISFGVGAFMLVLFRRAYDALHTDDIDLFTNTDS
jgi:multicomponent Na+:H+ antiporter subunit C